MAGERVEPLNCSGGHGLERAKVEAEGFACDLCQNSIRGGTFIYSCDDCEYDVCHDCVEANGSKFSTSITPMSKKSLYSYEVINHMLHEHSIFKDEFQLLDLMLRFLYPSCNRCDRVTDWDDICPGYFEANPNVEGDVVYEICEIHHDCKKNHALCIECFPHHNRCEDCAEHQKEWNNAEHHMGFYHDFWQPTYDPNGRASCKKCSETIEKHSKRAIQMYWNIQISQLKPHYFHWDCIPDWAKMECKYHFLRYEQNEPFLEDFGFTEIACPECHPKTNTTATAPEEEDTTNTTEGSGLNESLEAAQPQLLQSGTVVAPTKAKGKKRKRKGSFAKFKKKIKTSRILWKGRQ